MPLCATAFFIGAVMAVDITPLGVSIVNIDAETYEGEYDLYCSALGSKDLSISIDPEGVTYE